ncbi:MAG: DUF4185 domain-containing protein [Mycobacteriales bacterium]
MGGEDMRGEPVGTPGVTTGEAAQPPSRVRAAGWPEADRLFHTDPRWLGADDAYTVPLGGDRVLWLFGDSFVNLDVGGGRSGAAMPRNSVGLQHGLDPAVARMRFAWQEVRPPRELFTDGEPDWWLWPLAGIRLGVSLLLFFMRVRCPHAVSRGATADWRAYGSLGFFEVTGWTARVVVDPDLPIGEWQVAPARLPPDTVLVAGRPVLGTALVADGGWLYSYAFCGGDALLARWPLIAAAAGDLSAPSWWHGAGWSSHRVDAAAVLTDARTEFTVHRDPAGGLFTLLDAGGTDDPGIRLRWAARPQGPWSPPRRVFVPPEAARDGVLVYAGKAHPELTGARLVASYASIALDCERTLADTELYWPRFVRLDW